MNKLDQLTQRQEVKTIAADAVPVDFKVDGDYLRVEDLSGELYWSVNGGPEAKIALGGTLQGSPGRGDMQHVRFTNRGGSPVTVRIVFGRGLYQVTGAIAGKVSLTAADIAAINPPAETLAPAVVRLTAASGTYTGKRMVSVYVVTGPVIICGASFDTGFTQDFVARGRFDVIGAVTVDATAGDAIVSTLG